MKTNYSEKKYWTLKSVSKNLFITLCIFAIIWGIFYVVNGSWYKGEDIFLVKEGGKYFFVDGDNKSIKRDKFSYADVQQDGFFRICEDGKWGYLDSALTVNIKPQYQECGNFHEGLAPVYDGEYWRYINYKNEEAIDDKYEWAGEFDNKKAVVKKDEKFFIIDEKGKKLKGSFFACDRLYQGSYIIQKSNDSDRVILNQQLKVISLNKEKAEEPIALKNGKLAVYYVENGRRKAKLVEIRSGKTLLDNVDTIAMTFDGNIFYSVGTQWSILDNMMKIEKKNVGDSIIANSYDLYPVLNDGKWGAVDSSGKTIIKNKYEMIGPFQGGFASIESKGRWGIINLKGKVVIPCHYEFAQFAL